MESGDTSSSVASILIVRSELAKNNEISHFITMRKMRIFVLPVCRQARNAVTEVTYI